MPQVKLVRETDAGIVLRGRLGMHTSPAYAEDVYVGALNGVTIGEHNASFVVPVAAPGVTIVCRKIAARGGGPFSAPLTHRFDELDGQMWLDDVFVPWERVFLVEPSPEPNAVFSAHGFTAFHASLYQAQLSPAASSRSPILG